MNIFGIILLLVGLGLGGFGGYYYVAFLKDFVKSKTNNALTKEDFKRNAFYLGCLILAGGFLQASINVFKQWDMKTFEALLSFGGAALVFGSASICGGAFYIFYYKEDIKDKAFIQKIMLISIPAILISLLLLLEGIGNHLVYPLVSGLSFGNGKLVSVFRYNTKPSGGLAVAFYGIIMILGVVVVYWICDHEFFKKYQEHAILDTCVLIVFPAGVIGARIGYVIGNWKGDLVTPISNPWQYWIAQGNWIKIWNGGLTILGGAIAGIAAGVIYMRLRRRYVDVRWAMDVIVPAILVAQAIGRWGNFFNHEVYGVETSMNSWKFLPTFIRNQMAVSFTNGKPTSEMMFVPLFLIESVINIIGYFVIRFGLGKLVPKILPTGSLAGGYLIWYGIVRVIMEPLRDPNFNMGTGGKWSVIWAGIYIGLGALLIGIFFLLDKLQQTEE